MTREQARQNRTEAIKNGDTFYEGNTCLKCWNKKRYTNSMKCHHCHQEMRKRNYNKSMKARRVREEIEQEWTAILEHHKAKPQLSCQRW